MRVLKVGDTVIWKGNCGQEKPKKAIIKSIEIDCVRKSGTPVEYISWDRIPTDYSSEIIFTLTNGRWCLGFQLTEL